MVVRVLSYRRPMLDREPKGSRKCSSWFFSCRSNSVGFFCYSKYMSRVEIHSAHDCFTAGQVLPGVHTASSGYLVPPAVSQTSRLQAVWCVDAAPAHGPANDSVLPRAQVPGDGL